MTRPSDEIPMRHKARLLSSIAREILERRDALRRIEKRLGQRERNPPETRHLKVEAATHRRELFRAYGELGKLGATDDGSATSL